MGRYVLAGMLVLALGGCTTVHAPPPGLSDEERADIRQYQLDQTWQSLGLPDDERPPTPEPVVGSRAERNAASVVCMNDAGFDNYYANPDGSYSASHDGEPANDEKLAIYICQASFWVDGDDGWYSGAQLGYLYDYYSEVLIPCISAHGAELKDSPTREWFLTQHGQWHPYGSIRADDQERFFADRTNLVECPPVPPGIEDPGYAEQWDQQ